jgi:pimeloyl-ACP methyl ester carboxylesterase
VLYFGGNAEEVSWMIGQARTHMPEAAWLLTDYRGYGSSAGAPSERAMASDALAWYDYARQRLGAARIYVFGRSLGSALAVRVAAEREVVGVVTVTPFDSLRAVASHYYPFLPVRWLLKHPFDSLSLAPRIGAPLLCLVATDDEVIPAEHSRRLAAAWGGATTVVELEGATHNDTDDSPLFWRSFRIFAQLGYIPAGSPAASRR